MFLKEKETDLHNFQSKWSNICIPLTAKVSKQLSRKAAFTSKVSINNNQMLLQQKLTKSLKITSGKSSYRSDNLHKSL